MSTCESVWFKIWNVTAAGSLGASCDKVFIGQYENVMYVQLVNVTVGSMIARVVHLIISCM